MIPFAIPLFLLAIFVAAVFNVFFIPSLRTIKAIMKLPGPPQWPVLGITLEIARIQISDLIPFLYEKVIVGYKRVSHAWLLGIPLVFINDPRDIEVVLSSVKHIEKGIEYFTVQEWLKEGLLLSKGIKWHTRRKLLTPTFHFRILEDKCQSMYKNSKILVSKFLEEEGALFNPLSKVSRSTLDVIGEAAMGVSLNSQDNNNSDYVAAIARATSAAVTRVLNLYLYQDWLWELTPMGSQNKKDVKFLHSFTEKIIAERKASYLEERNAESERKNGDSNIDVGVKKKQAFLDTLLAQEGGKEWTLSDIREEVDTFLFEGHDTSASAISFALYELGRNADIQDKAYQEQVEIFGDEEREITLSDIQKMNYLDRVIKETLRLYPSVPYISRKINEDICLTDFPTPIPAGSNVVITPYYLHRNAEYWTDPERFDPDRFLPEDSAKRHPFAYLPFSAGPRNCIGQKFAIMELKVILSTVLRYAQIESASTRDELILAPVVILRSLGTMKIRVHPRASK